MGIISVPQPSMALNAGSMSGRWYPQYKMYNSWTLDKAETLEHIVGWVGEVAKGSPGGKLRCLIVNSHGSCGRARLSDPTVLDSSTAPQFAPLKGKIGHILISACSVIGVPRGGDKDTYLADAGVQMSIALARATGARVYAGNEPQSMDALYYLFGGQGDMDSFEGDVLSMPPSGQGAWLTSSEQVSQFLKIN